MQVPDVTIAFLKSFSAFRSVFDFPKDVYDVALGSIYSLIGMSETQQ